MIPGLIDLHVHTSPDVRARSCDDLGLAREAKRLGARAVTIKSHHMLTADRALVARSAVPGVEVFGGVALNPAVGGLNPAAIDVALKLGGKIVWLPTLFAAQHRRMEGRLDGIEVVRGGRVVPAALAVLRQVAASDVVLATGHQSAEEVAVIVAAAWEEGVRRILINHPEHRVVGMTIAQQQALRREYPVFFERCYAQPGARKGEYVSNGKANQRAIEAVGVESTILATDAGQIENPPWAECWERMLEYHSCHGVTAAALRRMAAENPARLLGI